MQQKIVPNLRFDTEAERAAEFYVGVFENSRIVNVTHYTEAAEAGLEDRFRPSWQVVPTGMEEPFADPDKSRAERAMKATLGMGKLNIAALRRAADGSPG